jgi:hypothetical protein
LPPEAEASVAAGVPRAEASAVGRAELEPDAPFPADCSAAQPVLDLPVARGRADYSAALRVAGSELPQDDSPAAGEPGGW